MEGANVHVDILSSRALEDTVVHNKFYEEHKIERVERPELFKTLCSVFCKIETTPKRLEIQEYLCSYFFSLLNDGKKKEVLYSIYLCIGQLGPVYEGSELGLGESALVNIISDAVSRSREWVKEEAKKVGDLGSVMEKNFRPTQRLLITRELTIQLVFESLRKISTISGFSSNQRKLDKINSLVFISSAVEAKYLIRLLEGRLRIGLAEQTVINSLGIACVLYWKYSDKKIPEEYRDLNTSKLCSIAIANIKRSKSWIPIYEDILDFIYENGVFELGNISPRVFVPIMPMLSSPVTSIGEAMEKLSATGKFTCEFKYDGERIQIHAAYDGRVFMVSRNLENVTLKYPEINRRITEIYKKEMRDNFDFILDCETVGWDKKEKKILPFQELSKRKRKNVNIREIDVNVHIFAFDLLYLNGRSLINETLRERRSLLHSNFTCTDFFDFAEGDDPNAEEKIQTWFDKAINNGCEGLILKSLDENSAYEPSCRSKGWIKLKKDYLLGIGDSLDLVIMGCYYGKGKRVGVFGGFLLGCYDEDMNLFQSTCKIGSGFSEKDLENVQKRLKDKEERHPNAEYVFSKENIPDVWVEPFVVIEVKSAGITTSPVYKCGCTHNDGKGLSLRFPRYIKIREDKKPEDSTKSSQIYEIYLKEKDRNNI